MDVSQKSLGPAGTSSGLSQVAMAIGKLREAHLHYGTFLKACYMVNSIPENQRV